jgi:serine phosphatase RsbU (regulator of sigma subunit)
MSTTCGMLRLAAQNYFSPGEMLERVNEALFPYTPSNMFVTCFYTILNPKSGQLSYAKQTTTFLTYASVRVRQWN